MFKFRLLLLGIGILWLILGAPETSSYTYPTVQGYGPEASYGYFPYPAAFPAYPAAVGAGSYSSYASKGTYSNCGTMKVIEVLDHIFCQHGSRKRFSASIYPVIDRIIEQCQWTSEFIWYEPAWDDLQGSIDVLKAFQDSMYGIYGESSLLKPYSEGVYDDSQSQSQSQSQTNTNEAQTHDAQTHETQTNEGQASQSKTQGASTSGITAGRFATNEKLSNARSKIAANQAKVSAVKAQKGMLSRFEATQIKEEQVSQNVEEILVEVQVQEEFKPQPAKPQHVAVVAPAAAPQKTQVKKFQKPSAFTTFISGASNKKKRKAESRFSSRRFSRDAEYSDYTCALLPPIYCSEDKYDELLYNMLDRLFTALDLMESCMDELWFILEVVDCENWWEREIFMEAAIQLGMVYTSAYSLWETILKVENMYEIVELEYDDSSSYYRAKTGQYGQAMQASRKQTVIRPQIGPYPQGYPFFIAPQQSPIAPLTYPLQNQYRIGRAVSNPLKSTPTYLIVV